MMAAAARDARGDGATGGAGGEGAGAADGGTIEGAGPGRGAGSEAAPLAAPAPADIAAAPAPLLVVIRGPSGAGKSTTTAAVLRALRGAGRKVAVLEQDHVRNVILGGAKGTRELSCRMLHAAASAARAGGFDVVVEGILNITYCAEFLEALSREHVGAGGRVVATYLDASLDETKRRHATRDKRHDFGADEMATWYASAQPWGIEGEVIVPESSSAEETVARILREVTRTTS
uniref:Uncharacterized protein n=1 Tax=Bicosoecida sp. CB-2014 TaxID=1486930 RepID=A0A7S1CJJ9_9STRA|mmetsp:Transcript_3395/g.12317  ORF Transcript_3395/g.12317 Transcript_3395/m.12317 type:complete len:233 (+) Transcript_3395:224-922(+)